MVATHNRLATLLMSNFTTSLASIPVWEYDENAPKAKTVHQYNHLIQSPLMEAFYGAGSNSEYLDMALVLGRRTFLLDPANIVTKAQIETFNSNLQSALDQGKAANTPAQKQQALELINVARAALAEHIPRFNMFMEFTKFLQSYLQFSTTTLLFLKRALPHGLMRQASADLTRTTGKIANFVTSLTAPEILLAPVNQGGILPQSSPQSDFTKLPLVLKNLGDLVGIVHPHEINDYLRQTSDYSVYRFKPDMKFADWKQKLHLDVLEPLVGTPREYSKHDIVDRTLRMLANIPRFSHDVTQMTIKLLPTITAETTSAAMDEFYLIFQQIDRHYWLQADSGHSVPIEVNLTGWPPKKANVSDKIIAYTNTDEPKAAISNSKKKGKGKVKDDSKASSARKHQAKLLECWNCGDPDHAFYDCPDKDDPVKQAQKKLKSALKKRANLNTLVTDTAANNSDSDDANQAISTVATLNASKKKKGKFVPNSKDISVNVTGIVDRPSPHMYHSHLSMPMDTSSVLFPTLRSGAALSTSSRDLSAISPSDSDDDSLPVNHATRNQQEVVHGFWFHVSHDEHASSFYD